MKLLKPVLAGLAICLGVASAEATIISFTPGLSSFGASASIIAAPRQVLNSVVFNRAQQGFDERQGVLLGANLSIDGGSIAAGTTVDSHMIFLNKQDGVPGTLSHTVTWTFGGAILGVMSNTSGSLEVASSALLGAIGTVYPGAPFANRGLEGSGDGYTILGNQLTLTMVVTQPGDWIRVVTAPEPIPEPGTMLLLGTGVAGLALRRRRRA